MKRKSPDFTSPFLGADPSDNQKINQSFYTSQQKMGFRPLDGLYPNDPKRKRRLFQFFEALDLPIVHPQLTSLFYTLLIDP